MARPRRRSVMDRLAEAQKRAVEQQAQQRDRRAAIERETGMSQRPGTEPGKGPSSSAVPKRGPSGNDGQPGATRRPQGPPDEPAGRAPERSAPTASGSPKGSSPNGSPPKKVAQSRSRAKRGRRAR